MRARRRHHEEHLNHEAWAIPYGDLVTLLLAFFVVMYAVSSVNEGKYRVMADALSDAFGGPPRTLSPVELGETQRSAPVAPAFVVAAVHSAAARDAQAQQLDALGLRVEGALAGLVRDGIVTVRRGAGQLEIEIQSDLLFASGSAQPSDAARETIQKLGALLRDEANAIRIEGYTDDRPIRTAQFHSNWELSAARAASVVHVLGATGVAPSRLAVVGYGEHQPVADNASEAGRNRNRRVQLVVLGATRAAATPRTTRPLLLATGHGAADPVGEP